MQTALNGILVTLRGKGVEGDDGLVWYEDELAASSEIMTKKLQKIEFEVMSKHFPVLG